jgi:hypothetical protein
VAGGGFGLPADPSFELAVMKPAYSPERSAPSGDDRAGICQLNPRSADADLINGYLRTELQGRPLDANYVLRIWDDEGFTWDAVRDVQLLVKYRYWTSAE